MRKGSGSRRFRMRYRYERPVHENRASKSSLTDATLVHHDVGSTQAVQRGAQRLGVDPLVGVERHHLVKRMHTSVGAPCTYDRHVVLQHLFERKTQSAPNSGDAFVLGEPSKGSPVITHPQPISSHRFRIYPPAASASTWAATPKPEKPPAQCARDLDGFLLTGQARSHPGLQSMACDGVVRQKKRPYGFRRTP